MEFLVFWLGTIAISFGMEIANELRMFKDVADAGYKVDVKRLSKLEKELNPNVIKATLLSMLIPIFNLIQVKREEQRYNNVRLMILEQLRVIDALEEMSEIEKTEYLKNPTGLNALIVPLKIEKASNATSVKINGSEFYFELGESLDDITILKAEGEASRLTIEEQKRLVKEGILSVAKDEYEKSCDKKSAVHASMKRIMNGEKIQLYKLYDGSFSQKSIESTEQELRDLKCELLDGQRQELEDKKEWLLQFFEIEETTPPTIKKKYQSF